ncbi:imidazole glycerol phosphate synthase subunit HisH [Flavobacteriaceae bacterium]|nr:imidazole glycerol phosphate synthase subunit HisH [Flavobacteriaceae bacterium]
MIVVIDYGMGNLASVQKVIKSLKKEVKITCDKKEIQKASLIVLPGVGSFEQGMKNLNDLGLVDLLYQEVIQNKKPFLGICLGMQLIMEKGSEPNECNGLGWIKGRVVPIVNSRLPVPHLGWNNTYKHKENQGDTLLNNFYFIHSFHVLPEEAVECTYVDYEFRMVASIEKENIFATQFHPEKSQNAGLLLLKNYIESYA